MKRHHIRDLKTDKQIVASDREGIQERARQIDERYQNQVQEMPEYLEYFEAIDFELLNSIIKNIIAGCGIEDDARLDISLEKIYLHQRDENSYYHPLIDKISLSQLYLDKQKDKRLKILTLIPAIVHEYLHGLSYTDITLDSNKEIIKNRNGLSEREENPCFISLDEGLNEMISRQIVREYLTAIGETKFVQQVEAEEFEYDDLRKNYQKCRETEISMVDDLANFIAAEARVSKKIVLQAMIREKFTGENETEMWRDLMVDFLGEEEGEEIYNVLAMASDSNYIKLFFGEAIKDAKERATMNDQYSFKMLDGQKAQITIAGTVHEISTKREGVLLLKKCCLSKLKEQGQMDAFIAAIQTLLRSELPLGI